MSPFSLESNSNVTSSAALLQPGPPERVFRRLLRQRDHGLTLEQRRRNALWEHAVLVAGWHQELHATAPAIWIAHLVAREEEQTETRTGEHEDRQRDTPVPSDRLEDINKLQETLILVVGGGCRR